MAYRFLPHTADIKFEAEAKSFLALLKESAKALLLVMGPEKKVEEKITKKIKLKVKNKEELLYGFLEEFLYLLDAKDFIGSKIKKISVGKSLECEVVGDRASRYNLSTYVKAITYSEMKITKTKKGFKCQIVLDI